VLLGSLASAPLNAVGRTVLRASIRRSLNQRLLAEDWLRRQSEIADERIQSPLVVVGMMGSGTTLLQRLVASDPRLYAALGWEIEEPAPRPGVWWDEPDPRIADARVLPTIGQFPASPGIRRSRGCPHGEVIPREPC